MRFLPSWLQTVGNPSRLRNTSATASESSLCQPSFSQLCRQSIPSSPGASSPRRVRSCRTSRPNQFGSVRARSRALRNCAFRFFKDDFPERGGERAVRVGDVFWQAASQQRKEGGWVLLGLSGEVLLAARLREGAQHHRSQIAGHLVGRALLATTCLRLLRSTYPYFRRQPDLIASRFLWVTCTSVTFTMGGFQLASKRAIDSGSSGP